MASMIGATLKHLVSRTRNRVPRMDSIEEEDSDSPLTPKKFEEGFLKGKKPTCPNIAGMIWLRGALVRLLRSECLLTGCVVSCWAGPLGLAYYTLVYTTAAMRMINIAEQAVHCYNTPPCYGVLGILLRLESLALH